MYHFVCEDIADDFINFIFVKLCDNKAGVFTKHVSKDAYTKHVGRFEQLNIGER
jgi:hypothetical protein